MALDHVEEARQRLFNTIAYDDDHITISNRKGAAYVGDLRLLLTDHAALLARAEAAEAALKPFAEAARWPIGATMITTKHVVHCDLVRTGYPPAKEGSFGLKAADFVLALATYDAAHQQPAPVKAGGEGAR